MPGAARRQFAWPALLLAAALALAGCAGPTPYGPMAGGEGYGEQQLERNRYRVYFTGNSLTTRETIEIYMLYRSAEITLQTGHDYFRVAQADTEKKVRYRSTARGIYDYGPNPYAPDYRPYCGGAPSSIQWQESRYEAIAVITVYRGQKPEGDEAAYDARDVIATLGPRVNPS